MGNLSVGGQAVIEGVMMRSPHCFAVVCRTPAGTLRIRQRPWQPLAERFKLLRKPFFRGILMLGETLHNGMSALNFSAQVQEEAELKSKAAETPDAKPKSQTSFPIWVTMVIAVAMAFLMFAALPHFLTVGIGYLTGSEALQDGQSLWFHLVDGVVKLAIFLGYLGAISLLPDIQRVFQYHGAEHKSIFAFENNEPLTVESTKKYTTYHPRCGTSFLIIVLLITIFLFAVIFPFIPAITDTKWLNQAFFVFIKLLLLFPVGGIAYEVIRLAGKAPNHPLLRFLVLPGLWTQRITTKEPDDSQLEAALASLKAALVAERRFNAGAPELEAQEGREFSSFGEYITYLESLDVPETQRS